MFCKSCGSQIAEGTKFCSSCGTPVDDVPAQQPVAATAQPVNTVPQPVDTVPQPVNAAPQQPYYGTPQQPYNAAPQQPYYGAPQQPGYQFNNQGFVQQLPMNWFKFVIYFQLFANAVLNLIHAVVSLTGAQYGGGYMTSLVYSFYGGLKVLDVIYGICLIAIVAIALFSRFRLAAFKKDAITWLMVTYALNVIVPVIYIIVAAGVLGVGVADVLDASTIGSIVGSIALIICSAIYFGKRKHMFVN